MTIREELTDLQNQLKTLGASDELAEHLIPIPDEHPFLDGQPLPQMGSDGDDVPDA